MCAGVVGAAYADAGDEESMRGDAMCVGVVYGEDAKRPGAEGTRMGVVE